MSVTSPIRSFRRWASAIAERSFLFHAARVVRGLLAERRTGVTPPAAYQSLIHLYCRTGGWSNDLLHAFLRRANPPVQLPPATGVLGHFTPSEIAAAAADVRRDGYYVFPRLLTADVCDRLSEFAITSEASPSPPPHSGPARAVFDPCRPLAPLYRFREKDLVPHPDVQRLMADPVFLALAQAYLGCGPILDIVTMWWSVPFGGTPSEDGAQLFHFDMDRVKWLKFFVYLTDVTADTGPHQFVAGSHRTGQTPQRLLRRGYARLSDADVRSAMPAAKVVTFTGPRGTVFAEDTRGLHKGVPPRFGNRLVFELEYCDSLFGTTLTPSPCQPAVPELASAAGQFPHLFRKYLPAGGS